ncbi:Cyclin-dependent kinase inhibitor 3 (CDKN3) [Streptoalloteichus hindustanus]|uniref:Cyclin-dependent kinase inhibitor 3 (CDKN3) n=2 Tax=Streptoalloteichus hindustanus TaxID=2017 RepID=A0A1M4XSS6_STRHI|nr:Cyclin-dependent kinase inhibitor 3 (CDKN3) [Streptoalloteichus hindustanus]
MAGLRSAGVGVLVCALTSEELADLDLTEEPRAAREAGLRFVSVPIPDRSVPDLPAVVSTLRELARWFQDGAHVVTHCRFGIGRASLLAAAVLVLNGVEPGEAWRQVEQARGHSVPDTPEQREWPSRLLRWGQGDILAA